MNLPIRDDDQWTTGTYGVPTSPPRDATPAQAEAVASFLASVDPLLDGRPDASALLQYQGFPCREVLWTLNVIVNIVASDVEMRFNWTLDENGAVVRGRITETLPSLGTIETNCANGALFRLALMRVVDGHSMR